MGRVRNGEMCRISGGRVWDRPKQGWLDGVKMAFGSRGMKKKYI